MISVYSVLLFVQNQAKQFGCQTSVIIFHQSLGLKAIEISNAKFFLTVIIFGAFYLLMSSLESLNTLTKDSGLLHTIEEIYIANTVNHVMLGKDFSTVLKVHVLVGSALTVKLPKSDS